MHTYEIYTKDSTMISNNIPKDKSQYSPKKEITEKENIPLNKSKETNFADKKENITKSPYTKKQCNKKLFDDDNLNNITEYFPTAKNKISTIETNHNYCEDEIQEEKPKQLKNNHAEKYVTKINESKENTSDKTSLEKLVDLLDHNKSDKKINLGALFSIKKKEGNDKINLILNHIIPNQKITSVFRKIFKSDEITIVQKKDLIIKSIKQVLLLKNNTSIEFDKKTLENIQNIYFELLLAHKEDKFPELNDTQLEIVARSFVYTTGNLYISPGEEMKQKHIKSGNSFDYLFVEYIKNEHLLKNIFAIAKVTKEIPVEKEQIFEIYKDKKSYKFEDDKLKNDGLLKTMIAKHNEIFKSFFPFTETEKKAVDSTDGNVKYIYGLINNVLNCPSELNNVFGHYTHLDDKLYKRNETTNQKHDTTKAQSDNKNFITEILNELGIKEINPEKFEKVQYFLEKQFASSSAKHDNLTDTIIKTLQKLERIKLDPKLTPLTKLSVDAFSPNTKTNVKNATIDVSKLYKKLTKKS